MYSSYLISPSICSLNWNPLLSISWLPRVCLTQIKTIFFHSINISPHLTADRMEVTLSVIQFEKKRRYVEFNQHSSLNEGNTVLSSSFFDATLSYIYYLTLLLCSEWSQSKQGMTLYLTYRKKEGPLSCITGLYCDVKAPVETGLNWNEQHYKNNKHCSLNPSCLWCFFFVCFPKFELVLRFLLQYCVCKMTCRDILGKWGRGEISSWGVGGGFEYTRHRTQRNPA